MNQHLCNTISPNLDDHTIYHGELSAFDFEGRHNMKSMADKIVRDWNFDKQCRKNAADRARLQKEMAERNGDIY